jgi:hypothetical protein
MILGAFIKIYLENLLRKKKPKMKNIFENYIYLKKDNLRR